jgi:hypothetical protein
MKLRCAGAAEVDAIAFNRGACEWPPGTDLRIVYRLAVNDYSAAAKVQLIVTHIDAAR